MGCFSFICKESNEPVLHNMANGDQVHLFLIKSGQMVEYMFGNYDGYGKVIGPRPCGEEDAPSLEWDMDWDEISDLMFDPDQRNGIAAILGQYWEEGDESPDTRSDDDPDQGWGRPKFRSAHKKGIVEFPIHQTLKIASIVVL